MSQDWHITLGGPKLAIGCMVIGLAGVIVAHLRAREEKGAVSGSAGPKVADSFNPVQKQEVKQEFQPTFSPTVNVFPSVSAAQLEPPIASGPRQAVENLT